MHLCLRVLDALDQMELVLAPDDIIEDVGAVQSPSAAISASTLSTWFGACVVGLDLLGVVLSASFDDGAFVTEQLYGAERRCPWPCVRGGCP